MQIAILGHQPQISLAELESLYPSSNIQTLNRQAAILEAEINVDELGGTIKTAEPIVDKTSVDECLSFIEHYYKADLPQSKINLGFSYYGASAPSDFGRKILGLKKNLKKAGMSVRIVNQINDKVLNSAQVTYNKLLTDKGCEWMIIKKHGLFVVAKTLSVQDVDQFAARDFERPFRDAQNGMLPPKLALTLVNLATSGKESGTVLDPFCGTGVVLQEALLRGFDATGTDINPAMAHASVANLDWLKSKLDIKGKYSTEQGDATKHNWGEFDFVAAETYLGPPLTSYANEAFFAAHLREINDIHEAFLSNIHAQAKPGTRLALAIPAWAKPGNRYQRLPLVDHIEKLGYNHLDFHSTKRPLMYHRDGQYVARDVVVIERK